MTQSVPDLIDFLSSVHPYDSLDKNTLSGLATTFKPLAVAAGQPVYALGDKLPGLFLLHSGEVEVRDGNDTLISVLGPRNSFGERGLMRDGLAVTSARAKTDSQLLVLPAPAFQDLIDAFPAVTRFFDRRRVVSTAGSDLATGLVATFMAADPQTCAPETNVRDAAAQMRDHRISSLCVVTDGTLQGIVTLRDLAGKVLADALPHDTPVSAIMTREPLTLTPDAIGSDVLHAMMEHHIGHIPVLDGTRLVGIVTQTDLTRFQAVSSAELVSAIAHAETAAEMARVTAEIPRLLVQLVAGGNRHDVVTRLITDIADTATRRLLKLAEVKLGPAPVPYLWLACGSQGRQEQTGVSDQDNCLFIDDAATDADMAYFQALAEFVCSGLDICGYYLCPGDMMATNPRWCQRVKVWRDYFTGWIDRPNPEAQMLASVMFDLRPIGGTKSLFEDVQRDILRAARQNSIFVAHMISNSLKHAPPLGLLRGFATIRSGEHRNTLDMKHNGVVPVVDLGRIYALQAGLPVVNTRARLGAGQSAGVISPSGGRDLLDAYDLIAQTRLEHQAGQIRQNAPPDNFLAPAGLSDFERSHLRDAFVVIKTMQSALGHGTAMLG